MIKFFCGFIPQGLYQLSRIISYLFVSGFEITLSPIMNHKMKPNCPTQSHILRSKKIQRHVAMSQSLFPVSFASLRHCGKSDLECNTDFYYYYILNIPILPDVKTDYNQVIDRLKIH